MTLPQVLWTALSGAVILIVMMIGAWAQDQTQRMQVTERGLATTEQHYVEIESDLQFLRGDVQDIKRDLHQSQTDKEIAEHVR